MSNWFTENMIILAITVVGLFCLFKYIVLPWLHKKTFLPKDFDPFKNLEQYDNIKKDTKIHTNNQEVKDKYTSVSHGIPDKYSGIPDKEF